MLVIVLQDYPNYVSIGNVSAYDFANTTFTVSAWFKSSRVSDANESNYIITKRTTTAPNGGWLLRVNSDGTVHARLGDASATTAAGRTSVRTYYDNNWHHAVAVYTTNTTVDAGNDITLYVDGVVDQGAREASGNGVYATCTCSVRIGQISDIQSTEYMFGQIDEVRIYNRALSAQEIKRLYNMGGTLHVGASQNQKLTNGLVGLWSFDGADMAGTVAYDRSGQGNNGTLTNSPTRTISKLGQAMSFDGSNDAVEMGDPSVLHLQRFTLTAWIKAKQARSSERAIIHAHGGVSVGNYYLFLVSSSGNLRFDADNTTTPSDLACDTGQPVDDNTWYFVTATADASKRGRVYINGVEKCSDTYTGTLATGDSFIIGANDVFGLSSFNGIIDDVRIYNRALSVQEITRLYNIGHTGS